jgi:isoprenylcysteine carboxyl methyltransferase (ICMT) family protein YpbQ
MRPSPPPSAAHPLTCIFSVAMWGIGIGAVRLWHPFDNAALNACFVMAFIAAGFLAPGLSWFRLYRRALPGAPAPGAWDRVATKYVGLIASMGFMAALYWLFPEYSLVGFYNNYWTMLSIVIPAWLLLAPAYLWWADRRMREPRDGLWHMGRLLSSRAGEADFAAVRQHLLGWIVKGYFTPLMFSYMCRDLWKFEHMDFSAGWKFPDWYDFLFYFAFFLDTSLISVSYILSPRASNAHIRSTEPSMSGWIVALVCYQPFWIMINHQYINYDGDLVWGTWLMQHQALYVVWGSVIIVLLAVYAWATAAFGGRFSNMTHRGIITGGPYRWMKHPAYFTKNLAWWMITVPFVGGASFPVKLRHCLLLLMLNGIYYLRAKTEERHLSLDPVYVVYADWVDNHGPLRWVGKVPVLGALIRWRPRFGQRPAGIPVHAYEA